MASEPTNELNLPVAPPYSLPVDSVVPGSTPYNKQDSVYWKDLLAREGKPVVLRSNSDGLGLQCGGDGDLCWRAMVTHHWPKLLRHYGYSVKSRYVIEDVGRNEGEGRRGYMMERGGGGT